MEIGGYDIVIDNPARSDYFEAIREVWPQALREDDAAGCFFVYRNAIAKRLWDEGEEAADDPSIDCAMIDVIPYPDGGVTLVVGDPKNEEIERILEKVRGTTDVPKTET